jgi:hypothetical protein
MGGDLMIKKTKKLDKDKREFNPVVLKTKEEVLTALYSGDIKSSKFQLLSDIEKRFVELFVFSDHTAEESMARVIKEYYPSPPAGFRPKKLAHKIMSNPVLQDVLDELTVSRDKKFMVEINRARDMALNSLIYILSTTGDETLKAAVANTILTKAENNAKMTRVKEEQNNELRISIDIAGNPYGAPIRPVEVVEEDTVEIEVDDTDPDSVDTARRIKKQDDFTRAASDGKVIFDFSPDEEDE